MTILQKVNRNIRCKIRFSNKERNQQRNANNITGGVMECELNQQWQKPIKDLDVVHQRISTGGAAARMMKKDEVEGNTRKQLRENVRVHAWAHAHSHVCLF